MLVEMSGLKVAFSGHEVLHGVDFTIAPGERLGLVGESGSGKSMTAFALAGLLPEGARRSGDIRFEGTPLPEDEPAMARLRGSRIGMVFQEPMTALNPLMRVGDQIAEAVALHVRGIEKSARVAALLDEVGMDTAHAHRYPHQLSGGQRQRAMIAMALAAEPELLICDEPTSALDLITQKRILDLLTAVCDRRKMALLFISHDLKAVAALCERVLVLKKGELVESGASAKLFAAPQSAYAKQLVAASKTIVSHLPQVDAGTPLLCVQDLTKRFAPPGAWWRRSAGFTAVDSVSLEIGSGEAVALVGPSGCGKTTLARMIAGLDRPSAGELSLEGTAYGHRRRMSKSLRRDISLVFQDPFGSFDPRMRMGEAVAQPLQLYPGMTPADKLVRVQQTVESVGLEPEMLTRFPHAFSGGQRQRFAIARALVTRPKLVVLDEPVSALDVSLRADILELLNDLRSAYRLAYLMISHDLDMVRAVSDRVLVMDHGRIVERGAPETLFSAPAHKLTQDLLAARLPELP